MNVWVLTVSDKQGLYSGSFCDVCKTTVLSQTRQGVAQLVGALCNNIEVIRFESDPPDQIPKDSSSWKSGQVALGDVVQVH